MSFASLKYDYVFREVFSQESILGRFISDVTGISREEIKSVRVVTPYLWKRYRRQKQGILDVALVLNDDTRLGIELQIRPQKYWIKRNLFYLAKMYTGDLRVGEKYERLKKCIAISILDFPLIPGEDGHSVYVLRDREGRELTDLFEVHIIELGKKLWEGDAVCEWVRLFNAGTERELEEIETQNEGVQEAMEMMKTMSLGRSLKMMYEEHLKAVRDRWAEDDYVRDLGIAEGIVQGKATARAEDILELLSERGGIPESLRQRILSERDEATLKRWLRLSAKADSVRDFETAIKREI